MRNKELLSPSLDSPSSGGSGSAQRGKERHFCRRGSFQRAPLRRLRPEITALLVESLDEDWRSWIDIWLISPGTTLGEPKIFSHFI
ncbi:hypothetical protein DPEC_G00251530 [Dallia pectoralis]|uniref:Uncharacterized protein n=1 Tax=Dallia pectoralis TaxID=75939 RepID=A0ACC2FTI4_DALPE|nr:hypothetical protein DPEC_G00251530 [Dallia pectoralis]